MDKIRKETIDILKSSQNILIGLSGPDADSIGAGLALAIILKKIGKIVTIVAPSVVNDEYKFLPSIDEVKSDIENMKNDLIVQVDCLENEVGALRYEMIEGKLHIILTPLKGKLKQDKISFVEGKPPYDLVVTVDTGDLHQLGKILKDYPELFDKKIPLLNIDHHSSNSKFGTVNMVDVESASTTEVIFPILEELQGDKDLIDSDIATLLDLLLILEVLYIQIQVQEHLN
jgi:phosphoesterase RecJ-like protein